jgi:hypothetical protein
VIGQLQPGVEPIQAELCDWIQASQKGTSSAANPSLWRRCLKDLQAAAVAARQPLHDANPATAIAHWHLHTSLNQTSESISLRVFSFSFMKSSHPNLTQEQLA